MSEMPTGSSQSGGEGDESPLRGGQKRTGEPGTAAGWGGSLRGLSRPDGRCPRDSRAGRRLRAQESLDKALLSPATASAAGAPARPCEHGALPRPRPPRAASGCGCSYWPTFRATSKPGLRSREPRRGRPSCSRCQRGAGANPGPGPPNLVGTRTVGSGAGPTGLGTGTAIAGSPGAGTHPGTRAAPAPGSCRCSPAPAPSVPGGRWERDEVKGGFKINKQKAFGCCFLGG